MRKPKLVLTRRRCCPEWFSPEKWALLLAGVVSILTVPVSAAWGIQPPAAWGEEISPAGSVTADGFHASVRCFASKVDGRLESCEVSGGGLTLFFPWRELRMFGAGFMPGAT